MRGPLDRAWWTTVGRLGVKEFWSLRRDPMMLALIAYTFSVAIWAAATAMPEPLHRATIAVVDEDGSPLSRRLGAAFLEPQFRTPRPLAPAEVDPAMDRGEVTFVLDIPPHFQRDVLAGRAPALQLNVDATRMSQAFTGGAHVQRIVAAEVGGFVARERGEAAAGVELATRMRFNPNLESTWFGSVMELINNVTMLSIILTGAALLREREHGTLEHLLVMPVTPAQIMVAKVWAMGLVVLVAATLSLLVVVERALKVPIEGSIALFVGAAALHLFATTSLGIFLATLARSMPRFGMLLVLVLLPLQLLSGGVTPRESMPRLVQDLMLAAPTTHFVSAAQAVLYRGAGLDVVWPQLAAIAAIGTALFAFSLRRFRASVTALG